MASFRSISLAFALGSLAWGLAPVWADSEPQVEMTPTFEEMPSEVLSGPGAIPADEGPELDAWLKGWKAWSEARHERGRRLIALRLRLEEEGGTEASSHQPKWWNLPARDRQSAHLRFLSELRAEFETLEAKQAEAQAQAGLWQAQLEARHAKHPLPRALERVLLELQEEAEKDLKNKDK